MNNIPYYYDSEWKNHEINYLEFHNYKFIKDLSYTKNMCKSIILLFNYNGENILRGYRDGIIFPEINYFDINNIHVSKKEKKIQEILDFIVNIFEEYNIKNTKIYQDPYLCKKLGYSIFNLINVNDFKSKEYLEMFFSSENRHNIPNEIDKATKRILNNYIDGSGDDCNIYYEKISDSVFNSFVKKHFELAEKKTKSDKCWGIMKKMIEDKKAILLVKNDNYVLYLVSDKYSYYGINACERNNSVVTFLHYKAIEWLLKNNCDFIHYGTYPKYMEDEKLKNISKYKKTVCNKMYTQYYLDKI